MYEFPIGIYPNNISYVNPYSMFQFFSRPDETKYFLNYLVFRIKEEYKKVKNDNFVIRAVANIENDNAATIDIEYNFFVNVLGEWIEHYSMSKNIVHEFTREHTFTEKDEYENNVNVRKQRTFKVDFTTREKVFFDYGIQGWLTGNPFHKRCRFDFLHTFLNGMVYSKLVWVNLKVNPKFRSATHNYLLKDTQQKNTYVHFRSVKLLKSSLKNNIDNKSFNLLKKIGVNYEKVTSQHVNVVKKINSLNESEIEVKFYQVLVMDEVEKNRDLGDGKWHRFVAKVEENDDDIDEENE